MYRGIISLNGRCAVRQFSGPLLSAALIRFLKTVMKEKIRVKTMRRIDENKVV